MTFSTDFSNDKPDIREVIPAGTPVFVQMTYAPGGVGPDGALTQSQPPSDCQYLKAEFTVLRGPYKGRKFWSNMTFIGGKLDEKGRSIAAGITRSTVRMILDSSQGLRTTDESPEAAAKRVLNSLKELNGRKFIARVKVEPAQNGYPAKNGLGQVLTIDMKTYPTEAELDAPTEKSPAATAAATPPPAWTGAAAPVVTVAVSVDPVPASVVVAQDNPPAKGTLPDWAA